MMTKIRIGWLAAATAAVLAAGAGIYFFTTLGSGEDDFPAAVRTDLAITARDTVERIAVPNLGPAGEQRACSVWVVGADPPTLTAAAQARAVYVWAMCAYGGDVPSSSLLPVAVHLTDPPTAEAPGDGALYGPEIERIFPERLRDAILDDNHAATLQPEMNDRVRERS
ncbi:hypothetical protein ACTOB_005224 [Actinoplanes oblitus]|uniref:DUF3515 domain-containing protein n=1 Tax=Actinoplanes oblitus TaxID=3040509 RepID=A0ABY8W5Z2_9ACTN|nr:hypothetical protein [Actinoplanes oblitus]WIM93251.1 hypothetical protein ACTOB_005224 [Actinoplanes oblitus]